MSRLFNSVCFSICLISFTIYVAQVTTNYLRYGVITEISYPQVGTIPSIILCVALNLEESFVELPVVFDKAGKVIVIEIVLADAGNRIGDLHE